MLNLPYIISPAGPGRDIVGELEAAVKTDKRLRFGLYYSLFEWFHPLYNNDEKNNFSTSDFVTAKMLPELTELVMKYKVKDHGKKNTKRCKSYHKSLAFSPQIPAKPSMMLT